MGKEHNLQLPCLTKTIITKNTFDQFSDDFHLPLGWNKELILEEYWESLKNKIITICIKCIKAS